MDSRFCQGSGIQATIAASSFFAAFLSAVSVSGEEPVDTAPGNVPAHRIVLRIPDVILNSLLGSQKVDRQASVRDEILGTSIQGTARIIGKLGVTLAESPDQATFHIFFDGTAYSQTTGHNGAAIIHSRSVTTFTATKLIVFEPGKGFHGSAPKVTARTETFVEGIGSTRGGGLIGGIVRHEAARIEAKQHAETTEIATQIAEQRIAAEFELNSEERLARMNWITELRSMAATALRTTGGGDPKYVCSTTPHYLQIATSFGEGNSAIELPHRPMAAAPGSPIEIWIHESLLGRDNPVVANGGGIRIPTKESINAISAAALVLGANSDSTAQLVSLIEERSLRMQQVGTWRVISWDQPCIEFSSTSVARTPVPSLPPPSSDANHSAESIPSATQDTIISTP